MIDNAMFCKHLTTTRPLPPRPDIASSQTSPFDSVNSPIPILLAPIETLDEQKTDKKPRDKKKKKNKKKKDEKQDNPCIDLIYIIKEYYKK